MTIHQLTIRELNFINQLKRLYGETPLYYQSERKRLLESFAWQMTNETRTVYLLDGVFPEQVVYDNFDEAMTWLEETWEETENPDDCYITEDVMTGWEYGSLPIYD